MKKYRVTQAITVSSGKIWLNENQADKRSHLLIATDQPGVYLPSGTLCFKVGEVIGLEVFPKSMLSVLEPIKQAEQEGKKK